MLIFQIKEVGWIVVMKNKIRTTSFWLGLGASIVLILECLSQVIGIELYSNDVEGIVTSICSILVMLGIITKKNVNDNKESSK